LAEAAATGVVAALEGLAEVVRAVGARAGIFEKIGTRFEVRVSMERTQRRQRR
jgi:hypothetical protein